LIQLAHRLIANCMRTWAVNTSVTTRECGIVMHCVSSVCVSVCNALYNFWNPWPRNFIFGMHIYLQNLQLMTRSWGQGQGRRTTKACMWVCLWQCCSNYGAVSSSSSIIKTRRRDRHSIILWSCLLQWLQHLFRFKNVSDRAIWNLVSRSFCLRISVAIKHLHFFVSPWSFDRF